MLWMAIRKSSEKERLFACGNKQILSAVRKVIRKRKRFCLQKKTFLIHARPTNKEKLFTNPLRQHFSTVPKLTCNSPFRIALAAVSLQYNIPFSKLRSLASDVRPPFRTDSNPHRRYPESLQCPARPVT